MTDQALIAEPGPDGSAHDNWNEDPTGDDAQDFPVRR
jgi:hypothetical protein